MINQRVLQISQEYSTRETAQPHIVDTSARVSNHKPDRFTEDSDSMRVVEMLLNSDIAIARRNINAKLASAKIWLINFHFFRM